MSALACRSTACSDTGHEGARCRMKLLSPPSCLLPPPFSLPPPCGANHWPRSFLLKCWSIGMMVTRLAWLAHFTASSNPLTR